LKEKMQKETKVYTTNQVSFSLHGVFKNIWEIVLDSALSSQKSITKLSIRILYHSFECKRRLFQGQVSPCAHKRFSVSEKSVGILA